MTAVPDAEDLGTLEFLRKPVKMDYLLNLIAKLSQTYQPQTSQAS
jgi:hypothetical protein